MFVVIMIGNRVLSTNLASSLFFIIFLSPLKRIINGNNSWQIVVENGRQSTNIILAGKFQLSWDIFSFDIFTENTFYERFIILLITATQKKSTIFLRACYLFHVSIRLIYVSYQVSYWVIEKEKQNITEGFHLPFPNNWLGFVAFFNRPTQTLTRTSPATGG